MTFVVDLFLIIKNIFLHISVFIIIYKSYHLSYEEKFSNSF